MSLDCKNSEAFVEFSTLKTWDILLKCFYLWNHVFSVIDKATVVKLKFFFKLSVFLFPFTKQLFYNRLHRDLK